MFPNIKKLCYRIKAARVAAKLVPQPAAPPVVKDAACSDVLIDEIRGLRGDLRELMTKSATPDAAKTVEVESLKGADLVQ